MSYSGECFCGAVKLETSGEPEGMGYCHCQSCRSWSGGPVNAFTLWQPQHVKVTKGAEQLGHEWRIHRATRNVEHVRNCQRRRPHEFAPVGHCCRGIAGGDRRMATCCIARERERRRVRWRNHCRHARSIGQ